MKMDLERCVVGLSEWYSAPAAVAQLHNISKGEKRKGIVERAMSQSGNLMHPSKVCKQWLHNGTCSFGSRCLYHHALPQEHSSAPCEPSAKPGRCPLRSIVQDANAPFVPQFKSNTESVATPAPFTATTASAPVSMDSSQLLYLFDASGGFRGVVLPSGAVVPPNVQLLQQQQQQPGFFG